MTLTDEQLAEIKARYAGQEWFDQRRTDIRALLDEVARQRKFETDALPVLDAYEHMHTRAVRAEAEIGRLRRIIEDLEARDEAIAW